MVTLLGQRWSQREYKPSSGVWTGTPHFCQSIRTVGGIEVNLNRFAARHREVSCCGCVWTPQECTSAAGGSQLLHLTEC
jgi:hypothetical protein